MKMISNFVLALGVAGTLSVASAATPVTISFDGFCDGMAVSTGDGLVGGTLTGCSTGFILGNKGIAYGLIPLNGTTGVVDAVQSSVLGSSEVLTYFLDFDNGTWANYGDSGSGMFLINFGTFTVDGNGVKGALTGPPSHVKKPGAAPKGLAYTNAATIQFDGFCDGMTLSFAGDLIQGSAAGCSTGIVAGNTGTDFSIEPFGANGSGVAANVGSTVDGDGFLLNYYLDFANRTWANYDTTNGVPAFLRSGTFTVLSGGPAGVQSGPASSHR